MRDATRHPAGPAPDSWAQAFNALPLERPQTDAWADIAARLPVRKRAHWPARLAIAATLALAVIVPLRMLPTSKQTASPPAPVAAATTQPETLTYNRPDLSSEDHQHLKERGFVFRAGFGSFNDETAFHAPEYLRREWSRYLDPVTLTRGGLANYLDLSVWRKRA